MTKKGAVQVSRHDPTNDLLVEVDSGGGGSRVRFEQVPGFVRKGDILLARNIADQFFRDTGYTRAREIRDLLDDVL